jgi:hypothetical protein
MQPAPASGTLTLHGAAPRPSFCLDITSQNFPVLPPADAAAEFFFQTCFQRFRVQLLVDAALNINEVGIPTNLPIQNFTAGQGVFLEASHGLSRRLFVGRSLPTTMSPENPCVFVQASILEAHSQQHAGGGETTATLLVPLIGRLLPDVPTLGVLPCLDGSWYYGQVANGMSRGFGCRVEPQNEKFIIGDFGNHLLPSGKALVTYRSHQPQFPPEIVQYEGDMVNGLRHGTATERWPDGRIYRGQFANGMKHGTGLLLENDGLLYRVTYNMNARTSTELVPQEVIFIWNPAAPQQ